MERYNEVRIQYPGFIWDPPLIDINKSINRLKSSPIIKMKGKIELSPESIALIEVQAPRDIIGNKKYQLNPEGYLP